MSVILDKQSGEFLDITISSFNNSFGRERIKYSMGYGIYTPIIKYREELEKILTGPQDDKTAKREQRKVFLKKCEVNPLLNRFFQLLLGWLNGGGDREYKIGEYDFSDYKNQNVILIVSGGNIITIFAKLLKNIVDKAVEVSSEAYQAGQLQLQKVRWETLLQYLQTLFNDLQQVQTLGQQVQELMQKVHELMQRVQNFEQQGQLTLPELKQQIDKFYQEAEALYKEAAYASKNPWFLQQADVLENNEINLTLSLSQQLLNAAHGVDGVMTHAEAFFNKLTITNKNILYQLEKEDKAGGNRYSILSHLLGLLLTDGVHSATGIDQNSLLYQITELSQKDYSDFDYGIVPNKPPGGDPNTIKTLYEKMETYFPIPSPLPQGFTLFRVKSLVQCQGGPQFKQSELTKQEFACKALGLNLEKLTPQSINQSDAQELERKLLENTEYRKLTVESGNPKNQIDKKYVSNIKNCLKYIKNFLLQKKQIILDSTKFNIKTIKDYLSEKLRRSPYTETDDFDLEAIIFYINYNTFLLNLSIQKWGEPWKDSDEWLEGVDEAERKALQEEVEAQRAKIAAARARGVPERELPPPREPHRSSVSKWATEYSNYAFGTPKGYINVLESFGSLSSIIESKYLLELTGYLIKMFLNFPNSLNFLPPELQSKSLSEILLDEIKTKLRAPNPAEGKGNKCPGAEMLPSKLTYINTTLFNIPHLSQIVKESVIKPLQAERYSELGFPDGINIVVNTIIPDDSVAMPLADAPAPYPIKEEESSINVELLREKQKILLMWKEAAEHRQQFQDLAVKFQKVIDQFEGVIVQFAQAKKLPSRQNLLPFEKIFAQEEEAARPLMADMAKITVNNLNGAHNQLKTWEQEAKRQLAVKLVVQFNELAKKFKQEEDKYIQLFQALATPNQSNAQLIERAPEMLAPNNPTIVYLQQQFAHAKQAAANLAEQVAAARGLAGGKRKGLIKRSKSQKGKRKTRKCKKSKKYKKSGKKTTRKFRQFRKCKKTRKHRHQIKVQKKTKKLIK